MGSVEMKDEGWRLSKCGGVADFEGFTGQLLTCIMINFPGLRRQSGTTTGVLQRRPLPNQVSGVYATTA